ncbi:HD domain-containing protein [Mesobacillus jeotgali]|uniref:HD domain-containing protein n=1 Tax=Mesobacillus jeotgali TaxID=129985 RepID=UPI00177FE4F7|nr:HD domain-containing protein [Mesobacillus jeotgali]UYZ20484.1 HD domain-containing protein [Mesobacillus jeotgali]
MRDKIVMAEEFVKTELGKDSSGHDWHHIDRVRKNARLIWSKEQQGDWFIIEMAALLHDIPDDKLNESEEAGWVKLDSFLQNIQLDSETSSKIKSCIETVSYKGGRVVALESIEAEIVQDADRLDALGAIGIARTFAFGGKKGHPIYEPDLDVRGEMTLEEYRNGDSSSVNHFYEKLLKLKDKMNTEQARLLAEERHRFMETFLDQFYNEWNGKA